MNNTHSSIIIDVKDQENAFMLTDSGRAQWFVDKSNAEAVKEFNEWFTKSFCAGNTGKLTVFNYTDSAPKGSLESHNTIVSFFKNW